MIYFTSDLHYGHSPMGDQATRQLAQRLINTTKDDTLVICGDIGYDDASVLACLAFFKSFRGSKMAIAGNHDVWIGQNENSWDRYNHLSSLFRSTGFHALEEEPFVTRDYAFVGALGWYDYSFRDDIGIPEGDYERKTFKNNIVWADARYIHWQFSDKEMTTWQCERLEKHLRSVSHIPRVIVVLHHVPTKKLLAHPRCLVPKFWRFCNAFLGSERLAEAIKAFSNVQLVVNGHMHQEAQATDGERLFTSIGGDYDEKQLLLFDGKRLRRETFRAI